AGAIHCDALRVILGGAPGVGGKRQDRIDDQGLRSVVAVHPKLHSVARCQGVGPLQLTNFASQPLVNARTPVQKLRAGDSHYQIAVSAELDAVRALDSPLNVVWIGPGPKDEVVLELTMISIIDEVDAGIDISVLDSAKQAHPGVPCFRIAA